MTSGLSTSSSIQMLDFEEFMDCLFPEKLDRSDSSLAKALGQGVSHCLTFWLHFFFFLLHQFHSHANFFNPKEVSISVEINLQSQFSWPAQPQPDPNWPAQPQPNLKEIPVFDILPSISHFNENPIQIPSSPNLSPVIPSVSSPARPVFSLRSASKCRPHPGKVETGGEDAHFFTSNACGVFDGVGGWAAAGIMDAAAFADGLMSVAKAQAEEKARRGQVFEAQEGLQLAFEQVLQRKIGGSSTALILSLHPHKPLLTAVLVGDSTFVLIRNRQIFFRAPVQQHYFNCPYQLGRDSDKPSDSAEMSVEVEEGDIIVSASDGFWDNFFEEDVVRSLWVWDWTEEGRKEEALAEFFCEKALELSLRKEGVSPFSVASRSAGGHHRGGKSDDITVVVSSVTST